jgi:multimeric flavodoxin WrbA
MEGIMEKVNILISDQSEENIKRIIYDTSEKSTEETVIISYDDTIKPCICCFGCWVKTPGQCLINDHYSNMGQLFSKCSEIIVISKCFYGGYSPFVKNVFDRSACPYLLPYFKTKKGETHHPKRYKNIINLSAHFYGKISEAEKETARKLIKANGINLGQKTNIFFHDSFEEIKGVQI